MKFHTVTTYKEKTGGLGKSVMLLSGSQMLWFHFTPDALLVTADNPPGHTFLKLRLKDDETEGGLQKLKQTFQEFVHESNDGEENEV